MPIPANPQVKRLTKQMLAVMALVFIATGVLLDRLTDSSGPYPALGAVAAITMAACGQWVFPRWAEHVIKRRSGDGKATP